ncbi:MAG: bifunctional oligoribonuclease/PAP phosphatase NrnA [Treponema sp.]|jgi:phosphoesterase RecJ-like protein|nr:bifunctional oligoribonuclease/PAP phosphatase NrnA [Treponema sp.]
MSASVPSELIDFIKKHQKFIVVGHREPDGDCIGSQLALAGALKRLGKDVIVCSAGPFKRREISPYRDRFFNVIGDKERADACVIMVDCSTPYRIGNIADSLKGLPTAIVDHHAIGNHNDSSTDAPVFLDPLAPSVTFMILFLIQALGLEPTEEEVKLLFFGLCTDTGFFRHIDSTGAETFSVASYMIRHGASPKEVFHAMNGGKSLASCHLLGLLLARAKAYFGGKLVITVEEYHETQHFGLENRDSDTLYQLLQAIKGVKAIAVIRQETLKNCTVGLRSQDKINVAEIAARFGGGGHKNAAGLSIDGTIEEVTPKILKAFADFHRLEH